MAHVTPHTPSVPRIQGGSVATVPIATPVGLQAFWILRVGFTVAPLVAGVDKFFNALTNWEMYLSSQVTDTLNIDAQTFMHGVGIVEIIAGLGVALFPKVFAYIVAAWLMGIVVNLLMVPGFYDIALRDAGLSLGALALARLSHAYSGSRANRTAVAQVPSI